MKFCGQTIQIKSLEMAVLSHGTISLPSSSNSGLWMKSYGVAIHETSSVVLSLRTISLA